MHAIGAFIDEAAFLLVGGELGALDAAAGELRQGLGKGAGHVLEGDAVLRALGTREGRHDRGEIELEGRGEDRVGRIGLAEHALGLGIGFHERHALRIAAGGGEELERIRIDREIAAGGAIFGGHVGDGRLVLEAEIVEAGAVEFDELAHHALLAQHFGDGEHEIGGGDAFVDLAGELEAHHFRDQHGDRLAQHRRLGLDAAHAPAEHGHAVDHGRVRVGAHQRIGIGDGLAVLGLGPDGLGQVFEVHLVADAGAGGHDAEIVEGRLAPAQELIALAIALVFELDILPEGQRRAEIVHHHRVVDDEVDGHQRIDLLRIGAELGGRVAHGRQIDHRRHAGEVLHQHARRAILDLVFRGARLEPFGNGQDIVLLDRAVVLEAQQVLEHDLHRAGELGNAGEPVLLGRGQRIVGVALAADREGRLGFEAVNRGQFAPPFAAPTRA